MAYTPPTVDEIRTVSNAPFAEYGYAKPENSDPDPLQTLLDDALAEFHAMLMMQAGVSIDFNAIDPDDNGVGKTMSTLINKAIRMWVEWLTAASQPEVIDMAGDFDMLSSAGAGSTSRNHRNLSPNTQMWHVWPQLDRMLRYLVAVWTEEMKPSDLPPDVPAVDVPGVLPKPGEWVMDPSGRRRLRGAQPPFMGGVAEIFYGS